MKRVGVLVMMFTLFLLRQTTSLAQVEVAQKVQEEDVLPYAVDAMSFAIANSRLSRLDVFVQVPYENLSFVKQNERYSASYEMTIDVSDSAGTLVGEKLWTEEIKSISFDESVSSQAYSLTQRVFELAPGRYSLVTILRDVETKTARRLFRQIVVQDYTNQPLALSDIMLVSKLSVRGDRRAIVPNVSANAGNIPGPLYIFFEAYNSGKVDSVRLVTSVVNEKLESKKEIITEEVLQTGRNQVFVKVDSGGLALGDYKLFVRAFPFLQDSGSAGKLLASTSRLFVVRWRGVPRGVKDLDLAIDQLQYVAKDNEISHIREAKTQEEKQKRFLEFWKKRNPNPNAPRNPKMEEYYAKVEYANKHFKHYQEGWRTDMGMVYIIFGAPNNVDRHPFDIDAKPYEVWSYYELNHQFIFVDQTGFGDYRLITPIWEVWQRPRN